MAIQVRRGNYADLDKTKLVAGEPFVTLDQTGGDYYVGMAISPSTDVRLATFSNLQTIKAECEQYAEDAEDSKDAAATSETNADTFAETSEAWAVGKKDGVDVPSTDPAYHNNAKYWADQAAQSSGVQPATPTSLGVVKPDGTTVTVENDGTIHAQDLTARADIATINGKVGANNGIATLDGGGKVPASQLPSYVDDVIEAYYYEGAFYEEDTHTTEITPESGKIYVDLSTNKEYRWGGSEYAEISASVALGETSGTAYEGSKGKANADAITAINEKIPSTATSSNKLATAEDMVKADAVSEVLTRRTVGYTSKNILHVSSDVVDTTIEGITYTITRNDEGEVTQILLNGTATADSVLMLNSSVNISGQSTGTVMVAGFDNASQHINEYKLSFERVSGSIYQAYITVYSGVTVTDLVCKPMVRDKYLSTTFEAFHVPVTEKIDAIKGVIPSNASSSNKLATASDIPDVSALTSAQVSALRTIIQGV